MSCPDSDFPGLTQCYNLDFTVLFVRETTLHLAFLSGLQSFKKLFLSKEIEIVTLKIELLPTSDLFCLFSNISQNLTIYFFFRP